MLFFLQANGLTIHVQSDRAFIGSFRAYVEEGNSKEPVEFVVGPLVSKETYCMVRDKMIWNNITQGRKDKIKEPRPLGEEESPPKVMIRSMEELEENILRRGNFWNALVPMELYQQLRESIVSRAINNGIAAELI